MVEIMKREIPDLVIIDLEQEDFQISEIEPDELEESEPEDEEESEKTGFRINMHIVLLTTILVVFSLIIYRVMTWGNFISQEDIFSDGPGNYNDNMDSIFPLLDADGNMVPLDYSDGLTIVAFGNAPFADDRGSENNLANLIAERTNATVYNCSISGSYLAAESIAFNAEISPMDAYCFYWLTILIQGYDINNYYERAALALGEETPPEAADVLETLHSIDFNTVDAIIVMYDATDYLMGHPMSNDEYDKDILCFTGNLAAGIDVFQQTYPHIRIIVMSPPYAFAIDEKGEYISSDVQRYGHDVLSTYSILESRICYSMNVSFVDNLYGSITEDNASEYLSDNLHLNLSGRRLIAERAAEALLYFGY